MIYRIKDEYIIMTYFVIYKMIRHILYWKIGSVVVLLFCTIISYSQISGKVLDTDDMPLPYATISIEGTSLGTTTNIDGEFFLKELSYPCILAFHYVGYESSFIEFNQSPDEPIHIILKSENVTIPELTITADSEDPAYQIIRNARTKRDYYKNSNGKYQADLYIKGLVKFQDAPESFMGQEIGDMGGMLDDSTRQGIVYLSESRSKLYVEGDDNLKEVMYASKVAGDDQGVSFNQYSNARFSFYEQFNRFGRSLVTPLADASFNHYRFKLEGTIFDPNGKLINKISVSQKSEESPSFFGTIYIAEDDWYIHSADLSFTGKAARQEVFDTIRVRHVYDYDPDQDKVLLKQQVMDFQMGIFAFKLGGTFSYFFSEYNTDPQWTESPFSKELFTTEDEANKNDSEYWNDIRPVPLTQEEEKDYVKKDSLKVLWESKDYLDSLDRESNRFRLGNVFFGYTKSNRYKHRYLNFKSPITSFQFNPIEGFAPNTRLRLTQWDEDEFEYKRLSLTLRYGFSDQEFKPSIQYSQYYDSKMQRYFSFALGRRYRQVDHFDPMRELINTYTTLFYHNNYMYLYDERYAEGWWSGELVNGWKTWLTLGYYDRAPLQNQSDFSFFNRDSEYVPNFRRSIYSQQDDFALPLPEHEAFIARIQLRWRPGQKFLSYARFRDRIQSSWPTIVFEYKKAIPLKEGSSSFDFFSVRVIDQRVPLNLWGYGKYRLEFGGFLNHDRVFAPDYKHFHGNETSWASANRYLYQFKMLPYYGYSHTKYYGELFYEHHIDGHLLDKIPLIKKLRWKTVLGLSSYTLGRDDTYLEGSLGFEDIGWNTFRFLRLDYVWSFRNQGLVDHGIMISTTQDF